MGKKTKALIAVPVAKARQLVPAEPVPPVTSALAGFHSEKTRRAYERDLKDFFGTENLAGLTMERVMSVRPQDVIDFRDRLIAKWGPNTVCRKLSAIRTLYGQLRAMGFVQINPADPKIVRSPKKSTVMKASSLTPEELRLLLAAPDRKTEIGLRDYAMLLLASQAGLRREELCTLTDEHMKLYGARWCVVFRGKGGKERKVPLHATVVAAIDAWRKVRPRAARWMFSAMSGERCSEESFWKIVRKHAVKAGFDPDKKRVHAHGLRATFATILYEGGTPLKEIQELMGHSRAETTLGYIRDAEVLKSRAPDVMARALEEDHGR